MIYTIISKLSFINADNLNTKLFRVFLLGSVLYVLLHYYLFSANRGNLLEKAKSYLYYAMVADFFVAYVWSSMSNSDDDSKENSTKNLSDSDRQNIMKQLQIRKQMLMNQQSPFLTKDNVQQLQQVKSNENDQKKNSESKNDQQNSKQSSENKKSQKKETKENNDTELPIYVTKDDDDE